ncbi:SDR family NAD(P)-dependent oxidoreductase [Ottowia thiooxydans]|uniref:SDR family NAD(P)-dependent oxidoreductase n=1 Tax=Ottowia thiooxydans TaxID=219182 RepID=UPI0004123E8A|nr:SDR family NAD(P)-dependent oxidoreductase [Ottowia thiooxydans]
MNLTGKKLIVTGAASGIGYGAAKAFRQAGAMVFLADLEGPSLHKAGKDVGAAGVAACDVTLEADCEALAASAERSMNGLDGMFHCAGVADQVAKALDIDIDTWQKIVDTNLRGTFLACRAVGRILVAQRSGAIVNVSSIQGLSAAPRRHAYGPAKAAVAHLTRTLACEWGGSSVRVNAIAPAYIDTPMVAQLKADKKIDVARLEGRTPLARFGKVHEVTAAASFLLSDAASYVTGVVLPVDGGWSAYGGAGEVASA